MNAVRELYYDPFSIEIDENPHPIWARMREEAPIYYNAKYDFYALSRFEDVLEASKDLETFVNRDGTIIEILDGPREYVPNWLLFKDPPEHTRLRALVNRAFTPRRVHDHEARIRALVCEMLDDHVGASSFDYVADFAAKLPPLVIGSLLGIPEDEHRLAAEQRDGVHESFDPEKGSDYSQLDAMNVYFRDLADRRRARPEDDLITALVHAEITDDDGVAHQMSRDEVAQFIALIYGAGSETVAKLLGWAARYLAEFPDQRALLVENPALIPNAIEEVLRFEPPSPVQGRRVARDVECHGSVVPAGAKMLLLTGAAGRDPREFERPDQLDVTRKITRHLSFGYGAHFCLGAALARLEGRIALEETLTRFPRWELADGAELSHLSSVRGYAKLPIMVG